MYLIRYLNPGAAITTEVEARDASRASAIAMFIGAGVGMIGVWRMLNGKAALIAQSQDVMEAMQTGVADGAAEAGVNAVLGFAAVLAVVQLVLGLVQWFKPNIILPILFLVLLAYGLATPLISLVSAAPSAPFDGVFILTYSLMIVQALLHITGLRGVQALQRIRQAAA